MTDINTWLASVGDIRQIIDTHLAASDSRDAMAMRVLEFNDELTDEQINTLIDELERFVRGTPDILELAGIEADEHGVLETLSPLLEQSVQYFFDDQDLIPDHLGVYGMLDDAYLVQRFLLTASDEHQAAHGTPLLGDGLRPAIDVVRQWIGDAAADQLDAKVAADAQQFNWKGLAVGVALGAGALWLLGKAFSGGAGGSYDATGGPGAWGNSYESEMARMGASMGVSLDPW